MPVVHTILMRFIQLKTFCTLKNISAITIGNWNYNHASNEHLVAT